MKKLLLIAILLASLSLILIPIFASAAIVTCDGGPSNPCTICNFFEMLLKIYKFIVWDIATPAAVIALTVGGIFILASGGNPNLLGTGKKIVYAAIIGLVLVFCSYIIIGFVMSAVGYNLNGGNWWTLSGSC